MKVTISVKSLRGALLKASRALERHSGIPIVSAFHLAAAGDALTITTTNLDLEIEAKAPAVVSEAGSICIGRSLWRLLANLPAWEAITLYTGEGDRLVVDMPDGRASLIGIPAKEFPFVKREGKAQNWRAGSTAILDAMQRISAFISSEETRYYLNGIFFEAREGALSLVATNGHVLGKLTEAMPAWPDMSVIYPRFAVSVLLKTFARDEDLTVEFHPKRYLTFASATLRLTSKLIDGKYPDYARVIPGATESKARVDFAKAGWLAKLSRLNSVLGATRTGALVKIEHWRVTLSAASHDYGEIITALGGKVSGDAQAEFGANVSFLRSCLAAHRSDDVTIAVIDGGSPVRFDSAGVTTVLMPLRNVVCKLTLPEGCEP